MSALLLALSLTALPSSAQDAAAKPSVDWVALSSGSFMMGADDPVLANARPIHRVVVQPFELSRTLVTFKQYAACAAAKACPPAHVQDGGCYIYDGSGWKKGELPAAFQGEDQPVVCVDWEQASSYAKWAGGRLPTEAEWEYAARSQGKDRKYPWGDERADCERAVISVGGDGCGRNATWPVCSKPKGNTEQGLCDMAGNVWEWTQDWYHDSYDEAPGDGTAWEYPAGTTRVFRGGSWLRGPNLARSAVRNFYGRGTSYRANSIGFRVAR